MFCSHLAYPKPIFLYTSKSKLIENRIWQNVDRNRPKMLVITAVFGNARRPIVAHVAKEWLWVSNEPLRARVEPAHAGDTKADEAEL